MELFRKKTIPVLFAVLSMLVLPFAVRAYVWSGAKWPSNTVYYDPHTLTSGWRDAVSFGREQWNNVTPSPFTWLRYDLSDNDVQVAVLAPGDLGATTRYSTNGTITRIIIQFNSQKIWYTGSGLPQLDEYDGRGVAAHEFGHGAGFSETQASLCPGTINDPTMCQGYRAGYTWKRTLESDDRLALSTIYP